MDRQYLTKLIQLSLAALLLLPGCALLNLDNSQNDLDSESDPIIRAAMQNRAPQPQPLDPVVDQASNLQLGMSMKRVRRLWGEPQEVANAGDTWTGNQRWTYYEGLSSRWSMHSARFVYFERGRVSGWETSHR